MRGRLLLLVLVLALGCERERITALPPSPSTSAPSSVAAKVVGPPCAAPRIVVPAVVEEACWPDVCDSNVVFAIENCTDVPIRLHTLFVKRDRDDVVRLDFDPEPTIAARATRPLTYPSDGSKRWLPLGKYELIAGVMREGDDAAAEQVLEASFVRVDPGLEKEKLECLARGDDWGPVGMAGTLRCAAVMKDEGKPCSDESECGGYCFFEREVVVSATEKKVFGRCSRTRERFGCHRIIGKTSGGKGLIAIHSRVPSLCVD